MSARFVLPYFIFSSYCLINQKDYIYLVKNISSSMNQLLKPLLLLFFFGSFNAFSQPDRLLLVGRGPEKHDSSSQALSQGSLVIVGGGLEHTNKSVYDQLIGLAGGAEKATFAVIPSSSGVSVQSYMSFRHILISYGVKPENIHLINIAMVDDDSTSDVNESTWSNNGNDIRLAEIVRSCSAVWFTGGDQMRTIKTLIRPDGSKTPDGDKAMAILQKALNHGLVGYMAGRTGQVIRLIPPLVVTEEQINKALEILEVSMSEV